MAKLVLKDAYVSINGKPLSVRVKSVSFPFAPDMLDAAAMGSTYQEKGAGLIDASLEVEFYQDFSATAGMDVDASLFPLVGADAFPVVVRASSAVVSPTNPQYAGNMVLESYTPIGGSVGQYAMAPLKLKCAGAIARTTA